ncbi:MAG: cytidylate kinase-like family protein [Oscillospiraceae bacterium]|nr:cytidylate kinase-like family protein [Oscillospiraceae bacterium]
MKKNIITISRQFGSGGRTIGRLVAQKLNIPFYDKELVEQIALESGFAPHYVEEHGEHAPGKTIFSYTFAAQGAHGSGMSAADFLWNIQCSTILQLADKGPCVIVGRNADYILKDRNDVFHAFIHAPMEHRAERIVRLYGESEKSPEVRLQEKDKRRKVNYHHYTGRSWGDASLYDISINTAAIDLEKAADIIVDLVK